MNTRMRWKLIRFAGVLNIKDVAAALNISTGHISNFENGARAMSNQKVLKYMNYIKSYQLGQSEGTK